MAIRDKMTRNVEPHLRPGETLQVVFGAQTASQYLILLAYVAFFVANRYRVVAVTDQRIMVFDAGRWTQTQTRSLVYEVDRSTRFGEPDATIWAVRPLGPDTLRIHRRWWKDMAVADLAAGAPPAAPPA